MIASAHNPGFEVCDSTVGESVVLAGSGQFIGDTAQLGLLISDGAFEREVLTGHADAIVFGPAGGQFADLAEKLGDLLALAQATAPKRLGPAPTVRDQSAVPPQ